MLGSLIFVGYGLLHVWLLSMAYQMWQERRQLYLVFLVLVILGMAYDNLVIGFGRFIGEGALLQSLNTPRYISHAFVVPTIMFVGLNLARNAGVKWTSSKMGQMIVVGLMFLMIAVGFYADVVVLELGAAFDYGTVRYVNEGGLPGPPIAPIVTIIVLIVCGVAIFRRQRWSWLMVGAIVMFVTAAGNLGIVTNIGELGLAAGMVYTARRFGEAGAAEGFAPPAT